MLSLNKLVLLACAACLGVAPLAAQNNSAAPAPPDSGDIGPGELSNFTLNGTVTRPADPPPARPTPPVTRPEPAPPAATTTDRPAPPATTTRPAEPQPSPANDDLFRRPPTLPDATAANAVTAAPPTVAGGAPTIVPPPPSEGFSLLPWLIALLAAAGAAAIFFGRRRSQQRLAPAGHRSIDIATRQQREPRPEPQPAPGPAPPAAAPRTTPATAPAPTGGARRPLPTTRMPKHPAAPAVQPRPDPVVPGAIVSTGLRPWIDIELHPDRALLDEGGAAIAFEVTLFNSGSAPARDVTIEARLLNAGANQDAELSAFFTGIVKAGDPIPQIAPYARVPLRSAVRLPRTEIHEYAVEDRKLFMPLVAISVRYRWSSGGGQSAAGFLVGQGADGQAKLAPFRLDRGSRSWKGLGARRYEKGLRS